jgi:hypothetical protein
VSWSGTFTQRVAREALAVPDSFHDLGGQASTNAVLLSYRPRVGTRGTFLVPLDEGGVARFFANEEMLFDFAMVGDRSALQRARLPLLPRGPAAPGDAATGPPDSGAGESNRRLPRVRVP